MIRKMSVKHLEKKLEKVNMMLFPKLVAIHRSSDNRRSVIHFFLFVILLGLALTSCSGTTIPPLFSAENGKAEPSMHVTVDRSSLAGISQFSPGITYEDNSLDYQSDNNNPGAINNVKSLIRQAIPFENTHIMAWGAPDPWPDPSWMKGQLEPDGTTRLLQPSDEWSNIAYDSRILDNKMDVWLHLVQRVAERYMVAPYNVRYFQVWNELKGYYNPITNAYDYTTSPGDPSGSNARHGYTYMYNLVYGRLMQVARSLGIAAESVKIGGPYVVMDTWSSSGTQSNPSNITKAYGTYDQRPLDVVQYWLQHKAGAGFITVDSSNGNKDRVNRADPFTASEIFADVTHWIRSLDNTRYPGAATLPIWWAEWYATSYDNTPDNNYNNAIKSYAMIKFLEAGGAVALSWGGLGDGQSDTGLWTSTTAGGGQPLPWYYSTKAFTDCFAPGTKLYETTVSAPESVEALASATHVMLVNKTPKGLIVDVKGSVVSLSPYQVRVISA